jgi:hypothetical protein
MVLLWLWITKLRRKLKNDITEVHGRNNRTYIGCGFNIGTGTNQMNRAWCGFCGWVRLGKVWYGLVWCGFWGGVRLGEAWLGEAW